MKNYIYFLLVAFTVTLFSCNRLNMARSNYDDARKTVQTVQSTYPFTSDYCRTLLKKYKVGDDDINGKNELGQAELYENAYNGLNTDAIQKAYHLDLSFKTLQSRKAELMNYSTNNSSILNVIISYAEYGLLISKYEDVSSEYFDFLSLTNVEEAKVPGTIIQMYSKVYGLQLEYDNYISKLHKQEELKAPKNTVTNNNSTYEETEIKSEKK